MIQHHDSPRNTAAYSVLRNPLANYSIFTKQLNVSFCDLSYKLSLAYHTTLSWERERVCVFVMYWVLLESFQQSDGMIQAELLRRASPEIASVEKDGRVQKFTTYTPKYMGLPGGAWADNGGVDNAGEGIVIGLVDTGVNPSHPSFSDSWGSRPYKFPAHFSGSCEVTIDFPAGSCNKKLVGARHFAAALTASGIFNASQESASPLDGDGHGTHTASTAAGNSGVPVVIAGMEFGLASGIAPRAQ